MRKLSLIPAFDIATMRSLARIILVTSVLLIVFVSLCLTAGTQSTAQVAEITRTLSPASRTAIERLSTFDNLPAEEWRYHPGDLANGEAPGLDDSMRSCIGASLLS